MNNKEFDNIIKSNLENISVTPSQNVGKSLGRKMLLKNIWFFHKKKAALLLILIGGTSILYWNNLTNNQYHFSPQLVNKTKSELNTNSEASNERENNNNNNNNDNELRTNKSDANNKTLVSSDNKKQHSDSSVFIQYKKTIKKQASKKFNHKKKQLKPSPSVSNNIANKKTTTSQSEQQTLANITPSKESNKRFSNKKPQFITPVNRGNLVDFTYNNLNNDYAKTDKSSFSFDAFITPYNQTNITNNLDKQYRKNWWDFYRETGIISSGIEGGVRANFDWKNIVTTTGIIYNKIREYKPKYIYESNDNEYLLEMLGLNEISGVQINGADSAHYVFYTAQNKELIDKIKNETYNTYHYISFPIKTGYEFKTQKFSALLQVGVTFNKLIGAKGTYLRRYQSNETFDLYYNKGIETALLTKRNSMLKKSYLSFLASVAGNVKISPSLDVFGEFNLNQSYKSFTQKEYFLQKDVINFGANFGIKYYLEPRIKKSNLDQELF